MEDKKKNIFVRIKDWFIKLLKAFWRLSLDAKIGLFLLLSPIAFLLHYFFTPDLIDVDVQRWFYLHGKVEAPIYALSEALCKGMVALFNGLMAIAGAYLIKGNFKKKD